MNLKTYGSIEEIEPGEWNSIVGADRLICRHEYLRAVEKSKVNDCRYHYPVLYANGRIVAHACLYYISTELDSFAQGGLKRVINAVRRFWPGFLILRSVECGTPVALGNTISVRAGTDTAEVLGIVSAEAERLAREYGVKVVLFRDFFDEDEACFGRLCGAEYIRVGNLPLTRVKIRWSSYREYLDSMRSHYRRNIQTRTARFRENGGTLEILTDFSLLARELAGLWRNAYDRAREYRREVLLPDFFENMDKYLKERSFVILARVDGKPAGFSLMLRDGRTLNWMFCGLDYGVNERCAVYSNMLYRMIGLAIEGQYESVDLGITTVVPKMDAGAEVVPLYMYMKHLNPVFGRMIPKLFALMTPECEYAERNVFKSGRALDPDLDGSIPVADRTDKGYAGRCRRRGTGVLVGS